MTDINTSSGESDEQLPELPRPAVHAWADISEHFLRADHYSAEQMRAYARAALATQPAATAPAEVVEDGPGEFDPAERIRSWEQGLAAEARGIERAALWVDTRRANFEAQHGTVDPETGTLEFGRGAHAEAKREYAGELAEISEGLRELMRCTVPTAGWTCSRIKGHPGPCAASFGKSPAQAPAAPSVGEPVNVEAVATVRRVDGNTYLDWLIEGGIAAMAEGETLMICAERLTDDTGSGEVYLAPPAAPAATTEGGAS